MNGTKTMFHLSSNDITAIATSVTAITAVILVIFTMLDRRTKVRLERFPEPNTNPQVWKIRVHYSNKPIEGCSVIFNGTKLMWDAINLEQFDILEGGPRNVTIPRPIFNMDATIKIQGNGRTIKKTVFHKIKLGIA
jgi:hypothetical protein